MKLEGICNGALQEVFDYELEKVLANIKDINADTKTARKLTIEITLKPNEKRNIADVDFKVKHTEAPTLGFASTILIGDKIKGKTEVEEIGGSLPGQMELKNIINIGDAK